MNKLLTLNLIALLSSSVLGCEAAVGTTGVYSVPSDAASQCARHCSSIGLMLDSVVVMASNVGCVCRKGSSAGSTDRDAASSAGGMAAMIVAAHRGNRSASRH